MHGIWSVIFHACNKYLKNFHTFQITTAMEYLADTDLVTALLLDLFLGIAV